MLTVLGHPLLARLDRELARLHGFVRAWRAVLEGDCWSQLEAAADCACDGAA